MPQTTTQTTTRQTLAQMIKAKYPDYNDIDDEELEKRIKAKYPGEYDDLPVTPSKTVVPTTTSQSIVNEPKKSFISSAIDTIFPRHVDPTPEDIKSFQFPTETPSVMSSVGSAFNKMTNLGGGFDPTGPNVPTVRETFPILNLPKDLSEGNYLGAGLDVGATALQLLGVRSGMRGLQPKSLPRPILENKVPTEVSPDLLNRRSVPRISGEGATPPQNWEELVGRAREIFGGEVVDNLTPKELVSKLSANSNFRDPTDPVGYLANSAGRMIRSGMSEVPIIKTPIKPVDIVGPKTDYKDKFIPTGKFDNKLPGGIVDKRKYPRTELDDVVPAPPKQPVNTNVKLPRELSGAKPRYKTHELTFANDLERALYIVAQDNPSARNKEYLEWIIKNTGMSSTQAVMLGKEIKRRMKSVMSGQTDEMVILPSMLGPEDLGRMSGPKGQQLPASWATLVEGPNKSMNLGKVTSLPKKDPLILKFKKQFPNKSDQEIEEIIYNEINKTDVKGNKIQADIDETDIRATSGEESFSDFFNRTQEPGVIPPTPPKPPVSGSGNIPPSGPPPDPIILKRNLKDSPNPSMLREVWNLSRGMMGVDLPFITSASFRQGLKMAGTKEWFKAWGPSIKSYGDKNFYETHRQMILNDPLAKPRNKPVLVAGKQKMKDGRPILRESPSILEEAGVELGDLETLSGREEAIRSQLAERIPVYGKVIQASNRAYTAYLNDLRLNAFRNLYEAMPNKNDIVALKQLGDVVNTLTGRGPLKWKVGSEVNANKFAGALGEILFSPKLLASNMQMLNPANYARVAPQVRKEMIKGLLRTVGAWTTISGLGALVGGEVSDDPTSSDFGKVRVGDFRLDPGGGMQQLLVLMSRIGAQKSTSSISGQTNEFGEGFKPESSGTVLENFIVNKLHPSLRAFYDMVYASPDKPFGVMDRTVEMALPLITSDLLDIAKENPALLPFLAPLMSSGMGGQYYEKGDYGKPKFIPSEFDLSIQGFPTNVKLPGGGSY